MYNINDVELYGYNYSQYSHCELDKDENIKKITGFHFREFDEYKRKSTDYNIVLSFPIFESNEYYNVQNMIIYSKRELKEPEVYIIYQDDKKPQNKFDKFLEEDIYRQFNIKFNEKLNRNLVKSINLHSLFTLLFRNEMEIYNLNIRYRKNYIGFNIDFYLTDIKKDNILERVKLKLHSITNIKKSILKLAEQVNNIIDYNNINREKVTNLLNSLGYEFSSSRSFRSIINFTITDILNLKKIASIDTNRFTKFYQSKNWDDEFEKFNKLFTNRILNGRSDTIKSLNIKGFQFRVKEDLTLTYPELIQHFINDSAEIRKLAYVLLQFYNKYNDLSTAIALVKLKGLTTMS